MPGWAHDKSGSNDASNLPTVRSYQRCSYFQVSGQFESEPRRATRLTADFTVSHGKNPKFGENAQAQLSSVTSIGLCKESFLFRRPPREQNRPRKQQVRMLEYTQNCKPRTAPIDGHDDFINMPGILRPLFSTLPVNPTFLLTPSPIRYTLFAHL